MLQSVSEHLRYRWVHFGQHQLQYLQFIQYNMQINDCTGLLQQLYENSISQINYNLTFGYKDFGDKQALMVWEEYANKFAPQVIKKLDKKMLHMGTDLTSLLAAYIHFNPSINVYLLAPYPPQIRSKMQEISPKLRFVNENNILQIDLKDGLLIMHSHNRDHLDWKQLLLKCQAQNSLIWYIEDEYDEWLIKTNGFKEVGEDYGNLVIVRKIGFEYGSKINLKFALTLSLSEKIADFYNKAGNSFKMISSNIGLILIRGHFSVAGRSIRQRIKLLLDSRCQQLRDICQQQGIRYRIINHQFIPKYQGGVDSAESIDLMECCQPIEKLSKLRSATKMKLQIKSKL